MYAEGRRLPHLLGQSKQRSCCQSYKPMECAPSLKNPKTGVKAPAQPYVLQKKG